MAVYTKTGDRGETGIFNGERVSKSDARIRAIGAIDEANSFLGIARSLVDKKLAEELKKVQRNLLTIGSILAGAKLRFPKSKTKKLEKEIDKLEGSLPVLKNFILPGGSEGASHLQYARSLVRRAERELVALAEIPASPAGGQDISPNMLSYMNRLSDYLFLKAKETNLDQGIKEEAWRCRRK